MGLNRAEPSTSSSSPSPRSSSAVSDCSRSKPSMPFGMHESASAGPTTLRRRTSSRDADSDNATDHNGAEDDHLGHDASSSSAAAAADVVGAFFSTAPAASGLRDAEDQDSPAPSHHGSSVRTCGGIAKILHLEIRTVSACVFLPFQVLIEPYIFRMVPARWTTMRCTRGSRRRSWRPGI